MREVSKRLSVTEHSEISFESSGPDAKNVRFAESTRNNSMTDLNMFNEVKHTAFMNRNQSVLDFTPDIQENPNIFPRDRQNSGSTVHSKEVFFQKRNSVPVIDNKALIKDPSKSFKKFERRRSSLKAVKINWTAKDDLSLDEQISKMIGPMPPSEFLHKKVEIRKLKVVGFGGYDKKLHEVYDVEFKEDLQIGSGRFGKVYKGANLDGSLSLAFKGKYFILIYA
jgi:hypothetical protein